MVIWIWHSEKLGGGQILSFKIDGSLAKFGDESQRAEIAELDEPVMLRRKAGNFFGLLFIGEMSPAGVE